VRTIVELRESTRAAAGARDASMAAMSKHALLASIAIVMLAGCSKSSGSKYTHDEPHFAVMIPTDLVPGKDRADSMTQNLSIRNEAGDRELFFVWAPIGSPGDPHGPFPRYGHEPDHTKMIEEGDANNKYVINERGKRTYIHKVITTGNMKWGVLCMASTSDPVKDADLLQACKSLDVN
jgi:hypothetical protein